MPHRAAPRGVVPLTLRAVALAALAACAAGPAAVPPAAPGPLAQLEAASDLEGARVGHAAAPMLVISFASWCTHCHAELAEIAALRASHPALRVFGVSYGPFEAYDQRGGPSELRAYVAANAPWLRVVPIDEALFTALGRPPKVPTLFLFDAHGQLVATYDRRTRPPPRAAELAAQIDALTPPAAP